MSQVSPTRMNLLQRRGQLRLAQKGVDLLKKKRDALVAEFFGLVREAMEARKALDQAAKEAYAALLLAQAFDGPEVVAGAALGVPPLEGVEAEVENVWGSKVPRLKATFPDGALLSPVGTPAYTLEASRAFRRYAEALIRVANTETRLKKIGEEIKKTTRRVNALEQVVIPGIRAQIRFIQQVLEQRGVDLRAEATQRYSVGPRRRAVWAASIDHHQRCDDDITQHNVDTLQSFAERRATTSKHAPHDGNPRGATKPNSQLSPLGQKDRIAHRGNLQSQHGQQHDAGSRQDIDLQQGIEKSQPLGERKIGTRNVTAGHVNAKIPAKPIRKRDDVQKDQRPVKIHTAICCQSRSCRTAPRG